MKSYKKYGKNQPKEVKKSLREMLNAMMCITKTGCRQRMLPKKFCPWQTVYFYFRKWKLEELFEELMHHLRESVRKVFGKAVSPSVGLIGSKSVRTSHHIDSSECSIDGGKNVKDRKNISLLILWDCQWQSKFMQPTHMTA